MRPSYRYALAALLATLLALGAGGWLLSRPPQPIVEVRTVVPRPSAPVAPPPTPGERDAALERVEQMEAETLGPTEAARRRRVREQMLDARLDEREHE